MDYVIGEFIYMLPSDMNLRIGRVQGYNNKILVSRTGFKIGTNLKINLNVKSKEVEMVKTEPDVKPRVKTKPNIEPKQDVKPNIKFDRESKPDTNKITYEEEKVALVLGITSIFSHEIHVYQDSSTHYESPQILRQPTNHFLGSVQDL